MGIRLVSEVLDHYHGPDARKLWLLAWAEKANDGTRAGWPTRGVLAHRTGKSESRVSHIAEELVSEGVLKRDGGGNRGGPARFILLPIAGKGAELAHSSKRGKGAPRPHPKPGVKGADSKRKGAESRVKGADTSPLPAETGSLPLIKPSEEQPSENTAVADAPTAQTILTSFIDWVRSNEGDLTKRTIGHLAKQIGDLIAQGKNDRHIRKGLADWFLAGQHSSTLDSFVNAAMNADARNRAAQEVRQQPSSHAPESTGTIRARAAMEAGRRVQAMLDERNRP